MKTSSVRPAAKRHARQKVEFIRKRPQRVAPVVIAEPKENDSRIKRLSARIDLPLHKSLVKFCKKNRFARSDVITWAVMDYLENPPLHARV